MINFDSDKHLTSMVRRLKENGLIGYRTRFLVYNKLSWELRPITATASAPEAGRPRTAMMNSTHQPMRSLTDAYLAFDIGRLR
jgi:hypothetical protein